MHFDNEMVELKLCFCSLYSLGVGTEEEENGKLFLGSVCTNS